MSSEAPAYHRVEEIGTPSLRSTMPYRNWRLPDRAIMPVTSVGTQAFSRPLSYHFVTRPVTTICSVQ
jgi:hypothetical protein